MLMVAGTFGGSFLLYEFIIRRVGFIRPLFGLKDKPQQKPKRAVVLSESRRIQ